MWSSVSLVDKAASRLLVEGTQTPPVKEQSLSWPVARTSLSPPGN